jgi:hypothetical protein
MSKQTLSDSRGGISVCFVCMSSEPAIVGAGNMHMQQLIYEILQQGMEADALADRVASCCKTPQQFDFLGEERAGRLVLEVVGLLGSLGSMVASISLMWDCENISSTMRPPSRSRTSTVSVRLCDLKRGVSGTDLFEWSISRVSGDLWARFSVGAHVVILKERQTSRRRKRRVRCRYDTKMSYGNDPVGRQNQQRSIIDTEVAKPW